MRRDAGTGVAFAALLVAVATTLSPILPSRAGAASNVDHAPRPPNLLTVDDDAAPLAVVGHPQFGWVPRDPDRGEVQTAYELIVDEVPVGRGPAQPIWRSGKTRSAQQSYVTAPRLRLEPDHSYTWKVRTWDASGRASGFSRPAHFDTGLLDDNWQADWIRRPGAPQTRVEDFSLLRKEVTVGASPVVRARAYVSAGQQYDLRVNGTRAAHGPSFAYPDEQYYEATDITRLVRAGAANAIAVVTHWSTPGQGRPASVPAYIARVTIDHADGTRDVVVSDAGWRSHAAPWVQGPPRNDEGNFVEHVDGRLEPVGWEAPGFDDHSWKPAQVVGRHPVAPFRHLIPARTHIVERATRPMSFERLPDGAYVADFGAVVAATPAIQLLDGTGGRAVSVLAGYQLDPDGHVSKTRGNQQTDMHWYYDERAGDQEFRPFDYLGYRYLEIDGIGPGQTLAASDVRSYVRHASMPDEHAARFKTSNPAVDEVWDLARHSALYSSQEQFVDTPTREKGPFLGDSFNESAAVMAAFGDRALTSQAVRDFARSQARFWPDGRVNAVYPNGDGRRDIPDATEQYVEWIWQLYNATGNRDQLATLYPVVKNIADYVSRAIDPKTGLVTNLPGGGSDYLHGIVDWPPNMRYGYDMATVTRTTENILGVNVFERVADLARALGRPRSEERTQRTRAAELTGAIHARLRRPNGILVDGLAANGTPSKHASQIANAYALAFGLVPAPQIAAVADYVVGLGNRIGVSTFTALLDALHAAGRDDDFIAAITDPKRPGYAQILQEGATFTWESWDARQTGDSESHGFGSTVLRTLQDDVLGVRVVAAGAARVDVATPAVTPMHASGVVVTQRGRIPITWSRDAPGRFSLDVTIPVNVVATIHVPALRIADVSDGHHKLTDDPGVTSVRDTGREVVLTVGAGHYELHEPARKAAPINPFPWTVFVFAIVGAFAFAQLGAMRMRRRRGL
ncbi:MAG: alpha-L-rhamnosidase [Actinomycetota bacterium]|nr:alpha-L-rhamnosidase [Actinomycetota bacterium]